MSFLFRGACYLVLIAFLAAVGLGRLAPRPASFRILKSKRLEAINGYHFAPSRRLPYIFDPDTGEFARLDLQSDDSLDCATFSTWEDEEGKSQVVGRWVRRSTSGGLFEGVGLARYTIPGGEALDRIPLDVMPVGRPCFMPGESVGVIFSGGDGRLYRLVFDRDRRELATLEDPSGPSPIGWRTTTAGKAPIALNDPLWPTDRRLGGRLIVTLTLERRTAEGKSVHRNQIWWLELNTERTEIVRAGRLIRPGASASQTDGAEEGQPNVTVTPEGGLALAFLTRRPGQNGWDLRAAPIEIQPGTGTPMVREDAAVTIAESRSHTVPIFSGDGRWVYSLSRRDPKPDQVDRIALPAAVLAPAVSPSHVASRTWRGPWN